MKTKFLWIAAVFAWSCNHQARYLDLSTNQYVDVKKDSSGIMMNAQTGKPMAVYVDTQTHDTIYGQTGEVVNGRVYKTKAGNWMVKSNDDEFKGKSESDNTSKVKVDGDKVKIKEGAYTYKRDANGDVKIENGRTQVKIDGKTGKRKVKKDNSLGDKLKRIL